MAASMSWMNTRTAEGNARIRREMGHDFPQAGSLRQLSYCRKCGCGASFAPTAELKIEEYRNARLACEMAKTLLERHDIEQILRDISMADSVGAMIDPTLYREKAKAMLEDKQVFEAALRFICTWKRA